MALTIDFKTQQDQKVRSGWMKWTSKISFLSFLTVDWFKLRELSAQSEYLNILSECLQIHGSKMLKMKSKSPISTQKSFEVF